jgi:antitoxin (DNA-binding transcriptional repressor) of toxin-antitoxin stability system
VTAVTELEQLVGDAEAGEDVYISRDDEWVAVLVSWERYEELTDAVGAAPAATNGGSPR